ELAVPLPPTRWGTGFKMSRYRATNGLLVRAEARETICGESMPRDCGKNTAAPKTRPFSCLKCQDSTSSEELTRRHILYGVLISRSAAITSPACTQRILPVSNP